MRDAEYMRHCCNCGRRPRYTKTISIQYSDILCDYRGVHTTHINLPPITLPPTKIMAGKWSCLTCGSDPRSTRRHDSPGQHMTFCFVATFHRPYTTRCTSLPHLFRRFLCTTLPMYLPHTHLLGLFQAWEPEYVGPLLISPQYPPFGLYQVCNLPYLTIF
jgi:hypothetical protein